MRWEWSILSVAGLAIAGLCADQPVLPLLPCAQGFSQGATCNPSKNDLKLAKKAFNKGLKLQNVKRTGEALEQFKIASRLVPQAVDYVTAREMARQQLVYEHVERGNTELLNGHQVEALAEFRGALDLDPQTNLRNSVCETPLANGHPNCRRLLVCWRTQAKCASLPNQRGLTSISAETAASC